MPSDIKPCPYCAEDIKAAAIVCKHCGRELPEYSEKISAYLGEQFVDDLFIKEPPSRPTPAMRRRAKNIIYTAIALVIIFLIVLYIPLFPTSATNNEPAGTAAQDPIDSLFSQAATEQARQEEETEPPELPTSTPAKPTPIPTGSAEVVIPASEAHEYEGQSITVEISKAYCSYRPTINGEPTFCNDQPFPGHDFTLVVWGGDWSHFDGQCIWVIGTIELFEDKSQIVAETPSQVSLCPE